MKDKFNKYLIILIVCNVGLFIQSCDTASNYKTLSTLFDGVPNPDSTNIQRRDTLLNTEEQKHNKLSNQMQYFSHKPYSTRQCDKCHKSSFSNKLVKDINELCFDCHKEVIKDTIYVHGPVVSGYCFKCHEPHTSTNKKLINKNDQNICYECHSKSDILQNKAHYEIKDTVCWVCHNPHGTSKQFFLK